MLLYLDLNCFNRPFDDQSQARIVAETEAVFSILQRVESLEDQLLWSAVLAFENSRHPLKDRRDEISRWQQRAFATVGVSDPIASRAQELVAAGFHSLDSAHLASAEAANCDRFLTCDDRLMRTARRVQLKIEVQNPVDYFKGLQNG